MECRLASTKRERHAVLQQRYIVFVQEFSFFPPREDNRKIECDRYDDHALFFGVWEKNTLIASCRLLFSDKQFELPTLSAMSIDPILLSDQPTAEISRITVASGHRTFKKTIRILQAMQQEISRISDARGIRQWVGAVEPSFLHLLNRAHLPYRTIGPLQFLIGAERYPVVLASQNYKTLQKEHP